MTDEEVIKRFHGLYAGAYCQAKRDAGDATAMPPWTEVTWLGKQVVKCPMDLWVYQEVIWETRPTFIIETGTGSSGSAFYFATLLDLLSSGCVITVDNSPYPELRKSHPRITYLVGDSIGQSAEWIQSYVDKAVAPHRLNKPVTVMVVLDSLHTYSHVKRELELYSPLVTVGCYLVVEDTGWRNPVDTPEGEWCDRAVAEFVESHPEFEVDYSRERHLLTSNHGGWLKRVK